MTGIISLQMSSVEVLTALVVRVSGSAEVTAARTARTPWWFAATSLAPGSTPPESRRRAPAPWPCCSHPDEVASELLASPSTRFQPGPRCQRNSERPPPSRWVPFAVALDCAASDAMNDDSVEPELGRPPLLRAIRVEAMEVITRSHQQAFVTRVEVPEIAAKRDTSFSRSAHLERRSTPGRRMCTGRTEGLDHRPPTPPSRSRRASRCRAEHGQAGWAQAPAILRQGSEPSVRRASPNDYHAART